MVLVFLLIIFEKQMLQGTVQSNVKWYKFAWSYFKDESFKDDYGMAYVAGEQYKIIKDK